MVIRVRPFASADRDFITSLIPRFSEFELPAWRQKSEIDSATQTSLQKAMEESETDSAIFIAEDEMGSPQVSCIYKHKLITSAKSTVTFPI